MEYGDIQSIVKHSLSGFILEILEYCDPKDAITREQYSLDLLKPIYNTLNIAYSSFGYKHTKQALDKMKAAHKERTLSEETKAKLRKNLLELNKKKGFSVKVTTVETKLTTIYPSIRETAKVFNCNHARIRNYIKSKNLFKNMYLFEVI